MEGLFIPKKFISSYEDKQCLPDSCRSCLFRYDEPSFGTFCNLLGSVNHDPNYTSISRFELGQKHPDCPLKWVNIEED